MALFVLNLAGAVALLLWAVRLIRTGVERAFMTPLRRGLRRATGNRFSAALAGTGAAVLLQSSTAVAMLVGAFAATGSLTAPAGVALMLGADLGSSIVAQILLAPIHGLIPLLLLAGVALFLRSHSRRPRQAGRILIGLALVLLSLTLIREATQPLRDNALVDQVLGYLGRDPASSFLIGALMAWAMHSSVASILMFVTFASQGLLPVAGAAAMVLGANLGGALIPFGLTLREEPATRRIMTANLILRGGGAALALLALILWPALLDWLGATAGRQAINLHLVFNLSVLILALPIIGPVLKLATMLVPDAPADAQPQRLSALDEGALARPDQAIANASRELLRMGEEVQSMLMPAASLLRDWSEGTATRIATSEAQIDKMHFDIKMYVSRLHRTGLTPEQSRRAMDIARISNHFEDAGDQIASSLVALARRRNDAHLAFSDEGLADLADFHDSIVSNARVALNVLMTWDLEAARQLIEEKDRVREAEAELQARHLARLRAGNKSSIDTSNLHQEAIRALKQVNTAFSYVAYPILEQAGDLLETRLAVPGGGGK